jgi:hypothetical protein
VNSRSLPAPSVQYAGPRPDVLRGARAKALRVVVGAPDPKELAALRVDRDDVARDAGLRVQHAIDHQRRSLVARFGPRSVVAGGESPRDLELAALLAIDLIERRIALRREITAVETPLDVAAFRRPVAAAAGGGALSAAVDDVACSGAGPHPARIQSGQIAVLSKPLDATSFPPRTGSNCCCNTSRSRGEQQPHHEIEHAMHDHGREQAA